MNVYENLKTKLADMVNIKKEQELELKQKEFEENLRKETKEYIEGEEFKSKLVDLLKMSQKLTIRLNSYQLPVLKKCSLAEDLEIVMEVFKEAGFEEVEYKYNYDYGCVGYNIVLRFSEEDMKFLRQQLV